MKRLSVLPALSIRAAISVFRCYTCDHVVADAGAPCEGQAILPCAEMPTISVWL
jgi:hypothetical protein